jgi:hypothetical protein
VAGHLGRTVHATEALLVRAKAAFRQADPARQPYGITAECADDQGSRFYLGQLS